METKKLNADTVKAVGGCQQDALVALLKEMGYEIAEPKPEGVYVVPGMYAEHVEYGKVVIAQPRSYHDDPRQYVYYVRRTFNKEGVEIDGGTLGSKHKLTVKGQPVLGYAK